MPEPQNYYGNCSRNLDLQLHSLDCATNSYCPLPNYKDDVMCKKCHVNMLPGKKCNCADNLRENCAECTGIQCSKCITGYTLSNNRCVLSQDSCNNDSAACPHEYFCPQQSGAKCQKCGGISIQLSCNCAGKSIAGCQSCDVEFCSKCIGGLILVNGKCESTIVQKSCSASNNCDVGYHCSGGKCNSCSTSTDPGVRCHCEEYDTIDGCKVCDVGGVGCRTCAQGLTFGTVFNQDYKSCQNPKTCFSRGNPNNPTSSNCTKGFYCDERGEVCRSCDTMYLSEGCHCNPRRKLYNCIRCDNEECAECGYGFFMSRISTGTNCIANYCTNETSLCLNDYACPVWTQGMAACEACEVGQTVPCQCFYLQNCETCDLNAKTCKTCLPGFDFNKERRCVAKSNVCSPLKESFTCNVGFMCNGDPGDDCKLCANIAEGQFCNCNLTLQENCKQCKGDKCEVCIDKYLPIDGVCVPNMCGDPKNTQNCIDGYYCPNNAKLGTDVCKKCNNQQQECKCGLLPSCQTCGDVVNTCGSCFSGYDLQSSNKQCVLKGDICDFANGSTICTTGKFCKGKFGDACVSCDSMSNGKACKCGSALFQNCKQCNSENDGCETCIDGYFPYNNICVTNTCNSGGPSSTCALGNYCPDGSSGTVNCQLCTQSSSNACQCGANFCQTCGSASNSCGSCIAGYELDAKNQCSLKGNICDSNGKSTLCNDDFYCNDSFGAICVSCGQIKIHEFCHCSGDDIKNCNKCSSGSCTSCITGFELLQGACIENNCGDDFSATKCLPKHQCPPGSEANAKCEPCSIEVDAACNCGAADNCKTCGLLSNTCQTCTSGHVFNPSTLQCVKITDQTTNICDKNNKSSRCNNSFFCNGQFGEVCLPCNQLTSGKSCNCDGTMRENCIFCEDTQCKLCIAGLELLKGECKPNKCGPANSCFNGFFCPSNDAEASCELCTTASVKECKCSEAKNCQTCSAYQDSCQTCLEGFLLVNGFCQPKVTCVNTSDCPVNQYCDETDSQCNVCGKQDKACNCGDSINCVACSAAGTCSSCLSGYGPDSQNSCSVPICSKPVPAGHYCSGPNETKQCPAVQNQCNCGNAPNCATCTADNKGCATCMAGSVMINKRCLVSPPGFTGVCENTKDSSFCLTGHACILSPSCSLCQYVSPGYLCNCEGNQFDTCTSCDGNKCAGCFTGYVLVDQVCKVMCKTDDNCLVGEMCGSSQSCEACNGKSSCNCASMLNCANCSGTKCFACTPEWKLSTADQCDSCAEGFEMVEQACVPIEEQRNESLFIANIAGMVVAAVAAVGIIAGVSIFYAKRPKKYSFQHNMAK
uniref:Cysteine-rich membrane protein 1 n=1 Tax=Spironucleus salmonicida TaxID=348837 RepID=V6LTI9_9EUKA|eukprot:EST47962.1 Cysteine-rich membrane protein 1 [Spironucleus salmonicida]